MLRLVKGPKRSARETTELLLSLWLILIVRGAEALSKARRPKRYQKEGPMCSDNCGGSECRHNP